MVNDFEIPGYKKCGACCGACKYIEIEDFGSDGLGHTCDLYAEEDQSDYGGIGPTVSPYGWCPEFELKF